MVSIKIMLLYKFTLVFELYFYNVNLIVHMGVNIVNLTKRQNHLGDTPPGTSMMWTLDQIT